MKIPSHSRRREGKRDAILGPWFLGVALIGFVCIDGTGVGAFSNWERKPENGSENHFPVLIKKGGLNAEV